MNRGRRVHKDHSALEALERGSDAWKARLRKRALHRVELMRQGLMAQSRGGGDSPGSPGSVHGGGASEGSSGEITRQQMQSIIASEWDAMDLHGDEAEDDTLSGDLPPLTDQEYEDLMIAMYEELRGTEADQMYVELYEETQRFEDEALQASIQWYQDEEGRPEPMQDGDDAADDGDDIAVPEHVPCPVCVRGALFDQPAGVMCGACPVRLHGTRAMVVAQSVEAVAQAHANVCASRELEWAASLPATLHCRCRGCGASTLKAF